MNKTHPAPPQCDTPGFKAGIGHVPLAAMRSKYAGRCQRKCASPGRRSPLSPSRPSGVAEYPRRCSRQGPALGSGLRRTAREWPLREQPLEHAPRHPDHVEGRLHAELHIRLRYFCSPYHQDSALFPFVSDRSTKAVLEVMARGQRRFVHDSPLEQSGFEPSVPLLRKGSRGVAEGSPRNDQPSPEIKAQVLSRDGDACGRLSAAVPFTTGPRFRFSFAPAESCWRRGSAGAIAEFW